MISLANCTRIGRSKCVCLCCTHLHDLSCIVNSLIETNQHASAFGLGMNRYRDGIVRFWTVHRSRMASPTSRSATALSTATLNSRPFRRASSLKAPSAEDSSARSSNGLRFRSSRPASMRDRIQDVVQQVQQRFTRLASQFQMFPLLAGEFGGEHEDN